MLKQNKQVSQEKMSSRNETFSLREKKVCPQGVGGGCCHTQAFDIIKLLSRLNMNKRINSLILLNLKYKSYYDKMRALWSVKQSKLHTKPNFLLTLLYFECIMLCILKYFAYGI